MLDYPMAVAADEPVVVVAQVLADVMGVPRDGALVRGELVLFTWFPEWSEARVREGLPGAVRVTDEAGDL